jgi:MFS family permease
MDSKHPFYGWKLVAVLFALDFLNMGFPYFGGTVINTYMLKQIPMERSTYGLGFTLFNLFVGVASVAVAASIVKWGAKATIVFGSGIVFCGTLWMAFLATKPWHYLVAYGVVMATGTCFSTIIPATTLVARWFKRYRGRAMAIPLSASGFAGFVGAPLLNRILTANGGNWRQAWEFVAGIAVLSGALAFLFVKERPEDLGQLVDGIAEPPPPDAVAGRATPDLESWSAGEAYRTRAYWMIFIGGIACEFPYFFFVAHWLLHLKSFHVEAGTAAWALALLTLGGIVGRLIGGWLMDKMTARFAFMIGLCCYFGGSVLALEVPADPVLVAFTAAGLYGIAFGWTFVCLNTMTANYYGPAAFPKLNGMMMLLTGIACAPAGYAGGLIFDRFGSYSWAFDLNMLLAAIGIVALYFATTPRLGRALRAIPSEAVAP